MSAQTEAQQQQQQNQQQRLRLGIVGFGHLGQYLYKSLVLDPRFDNLAYIAWIWNRTSDKIAEVEFDTPEIKNADGEATHAAGKHKVPESLILKDMADMSKHDKVDFILEVCHPDVLAQSIDLWLENCRAVYVGSPTGFSNEAVLTKTLAAAAKHKSQIFVPTGALWGVQDIAKMGARNGISSLHITMKKPAASTRINQPLQKIVEDFVKEEEVAGDDPEKRAKLRKFAVVYDGPVGDLCPLAPNNVNTMACAALASGAELGFTKTRGTFIIERDSNHHIIEIEVVGKTQPGFTEPLVVRTQRCNPCAVGAVTGMATYVSFLSSLVGAIATLRAESTTVEPQQGLRFC